MSLIVPNLTALPLKLHYRIWVRVLDPLLSLLTNKIMKKRLLELGFRILRTAVNSGRVRPGQVRMDRASVAVVSIKTVFRLSITYRVAPEFYISIAEFK